MNINELLGQNNIQQIKEIEQVFEEVSKDNKHIQDLKNKYQLMLEELINKLSSHKQDNEILQK